MRTLTFDSYKKCFVLHFWHREVEIPIDVFKTDNSSDRRLWEIEEITNSNTEAYIDDTSVNWKNLDIYWAREEVMDGIKRNIGRIVKENPQAVA